MLGNITSRTIFIFIILSPAVSQAQTQIKTIPLDWQSVLKGNESVVYIGDVHPVKEIKEEMVQLVPEMTDAGITHIALEMFDNSQQEWLDHCCQDLFYTNKILDHFERAWDWKVKGEIMLRLIDSAKRAGLQVIAIDSPIDDAYNGEPVSNHQNYRDIYMANNIAKILKANPNARILAFTGQDHVRISAQPRLLQSFGINSKSFFFLVSTLPPSHDSTNSEIVETINKAEPPKRRLLIPLIKENDYTGAIYVPEIFTSDVYHSIK